MAAGSKAPLAPRAAASVLPTARIRLPSESLAPSRAPPVTWFLALGSLLAIAPSYLVAIAIVAGDAVGVSLFAVPLWIAAMLAIAAAMLFMRSANPAATAVAMLAIAAAISMPARESVAPRFSADSIRNLSDGAAITLEGRINRPSRQFPDREYVFVGVERAGASGSRLQTASGTVRLTVVGGPARVRIGDQVRVAGRLRFARNFGDPGEFDYAGYLAREGIAATMVLGASEHTRLAVIGYRREFPASQVAALRARIGAFIDANLAGPERAEMRALVIGDRGDISESLRQRFALTGLAHMLVISGLHLGFVAAAAFTLVRLLMMFFPALTTRGYANKVAALAAALAASAYAALAMPHVSTARALVMVLAYTLAVIADRARALLASLALAAIVICLALPGSTADIGFQLSFASVLAIVLGMRRFAPWWQRRFGIDEPGGHAPSRVPRAAAAIAGYGAVSFWALMGVAPLTAYHFNQFSAVGVIANSVVVPIMALGGVVCGLTACAIGMVAPAVGAPLLCAAGWSLAAGTWLAGWFVRWPAAYFRIFTPTPIEIAIVYGLLLLWLTRPIERAPTGALPRPQAQFSARWRRVCFAILAVMLAADAGYWIHDRWYSPDLRVTFLSVGEGDAAVVRFAGGRVMLIDAGGAWPGGFDFGERVVARYLWAEKIMRVDYLVVSHPDLDHFGGMFYIARSFAPREFWVTGAIKHEAMYTALLAQVAAEKIPLRIVDSSMRPLTLGGASVRCLGPAPDETANRDNDLSMVLRIAQDVQQRTPQTVLFAGDLEAAGERTLLAHAPPAMLAATVLKAPHHGSRTSSSAAFIAAVRPQVAILSLGYRNHFNFPAPEVVERYVAAGAHVFRTDRSGAVSVKLGKLPLVVHTFNTEVKN
ncbi:MAG: DNA internalization-related competence protein ComEC/Rec2 [Candidatus Binataceae bacterium]